jgi:hypothetical protein
MLCRVEETSRGIAVGLLPPSNRGTGLLAELACCLGIEAETVQPPLHVATLSLVKADLIFRLLSRFVSEGRRFDRGRHIARGRDEAALVASALTRIPQTDNVRIKTRMADFSDPDT